MKNATWSKLQAQKKTEKLRLGMISSIEYYLETDIMDAVDRGAFSVETTIKTEYEAEAIAFLTKHGYTIESKAQNTVFKETCLVVTW